MLSADFVQTRTFDFGETSSGCCGSAITDRGTAAAGLAGLLTSQKGQGGGFLLSKAPDKISFIDILTAVGAYATDGRCAFGCGKCDALGPCRLHDSWSQLNEHLQSWAEGTTLADVAKDGVENRSLRVESGRARARRTSPTRVSRGPSATAPVSAPKS